MVPDGSASVLEFDDAVVYQLRQVGVLELDGELFPSLLWAVFRVGRSTVYLLDEIVERRSSVSLVAQVLDDLTSVPVGDEAETRVETVVRHSAFLSTEVHQLQLFSHLRKF
jgi:hypothetical protein